jgi:hypothetical protein
MSAFNEYRFPPGVIVDQMHFSSDGKTIIVYSPIDQDGQRTATVYVPNPERPGDLMATTTTTYRLSADGEIWNKVGD